MVNKMAKRGLGKGLQALIPETEEEKGDSLNIQIKDIHPNQYQPRKEFDQEKLSELAISIEEHGLIQPIIVSPAKKGYQIVAGERRWRAANMIGLENIPAIVREYSEQELMEIALIENLQREDLNIIEEANAYKQLIDQFKLTQEQIAERLGKSRTLITNTLRLLNLSQELQDLIKNNQISAGHGRALLAEDNINKRKFLAKKTIEDKLSVRDLEKIVKDSKAEKKTKKKSNIKSNIYIELEDNLQRFLGTKVSINNKNKKGKIEIEYYSEEDLDRIYEVIIKQ
jgi:ParB family chromosome partitioning protein